MKQKTKSNEENLQKVAVLRWGHRYRDQRLTSHLALTSRAFGVSEFFMSDIVDSKVKETIEKVVKCWGGNFKFKMGQPWRSLVKKWKENNGVVVHLTAYGENIQTSDVMKRIQTNGKDIMIIVGSQKVPSLFFNEKISDFNVAVGNQPHSECSSLAVFLDRYFNGKELADGFVCNPKKRIIPQARGKRVIEV